MRNPFRREPDPFSAARYSDVVRSVRRREGRRFGRWWQWALLAVFVVVAAASGYGTWLYYDTQGKIQQEGLALPQQEEDEPFNALLVGSDSRADLTPEEQLELGARAVPGERADTVILAHVDPAADSVVMVQFPRDLYVPMPDGGKDKINAALEEGSRYLIETVSELTSLEINKYVQVNIAGFRALVDAIGGVEICIPEPIPFDPHTGIEVTQDEVGMVRFGGDEALRFVRSRNFPSGDFGRIANQQKFLAAAINKVTSTSTFLNPLRIKRLADIAGDNLKTDVDTTLNGLRELLKRFRGFDPERYEAYTAPNFGTGTAPNGASIVVPDMEAIDLMSQALAANQSPVAFDGIPDTDISAIRVGVYNGTLEEGAAGEAAGELLRVTASGSGPVDIIEAQITNWRRLGLKDTTIRYRPAARLDAEVVGAAIPEAELVRDPRLGLPVDVAVVVGERFRTKPIVQLVPLDIPAPGEVPPECRR